MRGWICALLVSVTVGAVPAIRSLVIEIQRHDLEQTRTELQKELSTVKTKVAQLEEDQKTLDSRIRSADAIRTKRSWSGLFNILGAAMPDEVWLTQMSTTPELPRRQRLRSSRTVAVQFSRQRSNSQDADPTMINIKGYSLSHEKLIDFLAMLRQSDVFKEVQLISAQQEEKDGMRSISFEADCGW